MKRFVAICIVVGFAIGAILILLSATKEEPKKFTADDYVVSYDADADKFYMKKEITIIDSDAFYGDSFTFHNRDIVLEINTETIKSMSVDEMRNLAIFLQIFTNFRPVIEPEFLRALVKKLLPRLFKEQEPLGTTAEVLLDGDELKSLLQAEILSLE